MNSRVLDYVRNGGTLLVQYQRDFAWNKLLPAPLPAKMADQAARVTDANSPVRFLDSNSPLLNSPNRSLWPIFKAGIRNAASIFGTSSIRSTRLC